MNYTEHLQAWQDNSQAHNIPVGVGAAAKVWLAAVVTVNPDGTVDATPLGSRATKQRVPVPDTYQPAVGDSVVMAYMGGNSQRPHIIAPVARVKLPTVTGSKSAPSTGGEIPALNSLIAALADLNLIIDNTTT